MPAERECGRAKRETVTKLCFHLNETEVATLSKWFELLLIN